MYGLYCSDVLDKAGVLKICYQLTLWTWFLGRCTLSPWGYIPPVPGHDKLSRDMSKVNCHSSQKDVGDEMHPEHQSAN